MDLKELKKSYNDLSKKHKVPSFEKLNEYFEIDRIERDTDYILREVRKAMMEKIIGYVRFLEMILNPSQAPPMFIMFMKGITEKERGMVNDVYKSFIELELKSLKLEIDYSEEHEVETINLIFETWGEKRKVLKDIIGFFEKNWKTEKIDKKTRGYYG